MTWLTVVLMLCGVHYNTCTEQDDHMEKPDKFLFDAFPESILSFPIHTQDIQQQTTQVPKKMQCVFDCVGVPWCRSVNFQITVQNNGLHVCELLSTDKHTHPNNMVKNNTFTHLSIKNICVQQQLCLNGGTCSLPNREEYRCQCGKAFIGTNCQHGNPEYCQFQVDMCGWITDPQSTFKWYRQKGSTSSVSTGPTGDATDGRDFYVYAEATPVATNTKTELRSPVFAATSGRCFRFAYHMYGSTMGSLNVYVVDAQTGTKNRIFTKSGNQGQQWHRASATITSSKDYKIVFEVICGTNFYSDVALDDVVFGDGNCAV